MKNLKLKNKLIVALLVTGLAPLVIAGLIINNVATRAIIDMEYQLLDAAKSTKKKSMENYFDVINNQVISLSNNTMIIEAMKSFSLSFNDIDYESIDDNTVSEYRNSLAQFYTTYFDQKNSSNNFKTTPIESTLPSELSSIIHQYHYLSNNRQPLGSKNALVKSDAGRYYDTIHEQYHPIINDYLNRFGYYDIFLIEPDTGNIVYSVFKEIDYATSLKNGPFKETNLAKVFNRAKNGLKDSSYIEDFSSYLPSYNSSAAFIASPIYDGDTLIGVLVFQMPVSRINDIMLNNEGLGETGETYLIGSDNLMRSQSRFTENDTLMSQSIHTLPETIITQNQPGIKIIDKGDAPNVIASYSPLDIEGLDWMIVAEVNEEEGLENISDLHIKLYMIAVVSIFGVFLLAFLIARGVNKQLGADPSELVKVANEIASGNLVSKNTVGAYDHNSVLGSMKAMQTNLYNTVENIQDAAVTIGAAAKEISTGNIDLSQRTERQAASLEQTASSMEELTATVKQNAKNAQQASELANMAASIASEGGTVVDNVVSTMADINQSSTRIVDIISVIDSIAFQTNILALNAAVEAARAGEQGRGFAVVATEVRSLAQRSANAAKEIKDLIDDSVGKVESGAMLADNAGKTMHEVVESVQRVSNIIAEISSASQEQSLGINQVNIAITHMDDVTQQNAALVEEAAAGAESLEEQTHVLEESISFFRTKKKYDSLDSNNIDNSHHELSDSKQSQHKGKILSPIRSVSKHVTVNNEEWEEF